MSDGTSASVSAPMVNRTPDEHFLGGGFIRQDFHQSRRWKERYELLQAVSRPFVGTAWQNGRGGYEWPLDPLTDWSRMWEYPFVAEQLQRFDCEGRKLQLLDIGAAVTFFPFYLMRQGIQVTNLDFDARMPAFFERAFDRTSKALGVSERPTYLAADARATNLPDASFDIVTCISVLEHIPNWERAIGEISRLLKPNGLLILTFDVQHSGPANALSATDRERLMQSVAKSMSILTTEEDSIPADALTPFNGTWQPRKTKVRRLHQRISPIATLPRRVVNTIRQKLNPAASLTVYEDICVFGGAWRKRP